MPKKGDFSQLKIRDMRGGFYVSVGRGNRLTVENTCIGKKAIWIRTSRYMVVKTLRDMASAIFAEMSKFTDYQKSTDPMYSVMMEEFEALCYCIRAFERRRYRSKSERYHHEKAKKGAKKDK